MAEQPPRTLHIPKDIDESIEASGDPPALFYAGTLAAENGIDIEIEYVDAEEPPLTPPATAARPAEHPDDVDVDAPDVEGHRSA